MNKETLNKLKKCSKEFCDETSTHGLANIVKTDIQVIRIIWILLVLTAAIYCTYSTIVSVITYLNYDTITNFKNVQQTITDFPAVTICNLNSFDVVTNPDAANYIGNALRSRNISPQITVSSFSQSAIQSFDIAENTLSAYIMGDQTLASNESTLTREDLGFTLDTMLISCYFNGEECSTSDFYLYQTYEYGNCYTFNGLKDSTGGLIDSKKTTISGPDSGLRIELFAGVSGIQDFYSLRRGAFVVVHNNSEVPLVKYYGVKAQTGTATSIKLSRVFNNKLGSPFSTCRSDIKVLDSDSIYFKLVSNYTKYKQRLCFDLYRQLNIAIKYCNCNDPSLPLALSINTNICDDIASIRCVSDFRKNTSVIISENDCPSECHTIDYETSLDISNYPASYYASILQTQTSITSRFRLANLFNPTTLFSTSDSSISSSGRKKRNLINKQEKYSLKRLFRYKRATGGSTTKSTTTTTTRRSSTSTTTLTTTITDTTTSSSTITDTSILTDTTTSGTTTIDTTTTTDSTTTTRRSSTTTTTRRSSSTTTTDITTTTTTTDTTTTDTTTSGTTTIDTTTTTDTTTTDTTTSGTTTIDTTTTTDTTTSTTTTDTTTTTRRSSTTTTTRRSSSTTTTDITSTSISIITVSSDTTTTTRRSSTTTTTRRSSTSTTSTLSNSNISTDTTTSSLLLTFLITSTTTAKSTTSKSSSSSTIVPVKNLTNSILMLTVTYGDLGYSVIEESPALDFSTLLGIIGGQFGLFLGASFLTFFEFLEYFLKMFYILFKNKLIK